MSSETPTATIAPTLSELKTRECTLPELQAALVKLTEMHNAMCAEFGRMTASGQIRSRSEVMTFDM